MAVELIIEHNGTYYVPAIEEGITWATERKGCPGELKFNVIKDSILDFEEGDAVRLKVDNVDVFYGFVFSKKRDKDQIISVTAYDQLRYLKNKDTIIYENKTASELVQMLAYDFNLQTGTIEDTVFKIPSRVEENSTLFDMIQNALDATLLNRATMYVLYDDYGKLSLKSLNSMKVNVLIDEETGENFDYTSSIDSNTYNKIKLAYTDSESKTTESYVVKSGENINRWGVLQYFETLQEGENGAAKAEALLSLYNHKTRNLSIKNAFGDVRVRAGSLVPVVLSLGDLNVMNYMLVEKCSHEFNNDQHFMNLTLRGGEFIA